MFSSVPHFENRCAKEKQRDKLSGVNQSIGSEEHQLTPPYTSLFMLQKVPVTFFYSGFD